jgi:hypothetical protein
MSTLFDLKKIPYKHTKYNDTPELISFNSVKKLEDPPYEQIPEEYLDGSNWPKTTNIEDGYCGLTLKSTPLFIPISYFEGKFIRNVSEPVFLTITTAKAWFSEANFPLCVKERRLSLFLELIEKMMSYEEEVDGPIASAPPKGTMRRYGGYKTDYKYWVELKETNYDVFKRCYSDVGLFKDDDDYLNVYGGR